VAFSQKHGQNGAKLIQSSCLTNLWRGSRVRAQSNTYREEPNG
jgi:hypothetical protein